MTEKQADHVTNKLNLARQFLILLAVGGTLLYGLYTCAETPAIVHHSFSFGDINGSENKGVKILNYRYGDNDKAAPTQPEEWQLKTDRIPQMLHLGFLSSPPDFLYVKWRVLSTGKIYEDTVDLKKLLPKDMNGRETHFTIQGTQLSVYVIEDVQIPHAPNSPDCQAVSFSTCKCTRIYPGHWKNF